MQGTAHEVVAFTLLAVGDDHQPPYLVVFKDRANGILQVVVLGDHAACGIGVDEKLSELVVAEGLRVEIGVVDRRREVVELFFALVVEQDQLRLVRLAVLAQSAVEGNVYGPAAEISLRDAAAYHPLELYAQAEGDEVDVVGIGQNDVFAKFYVLGIWHVHIAKVQQTLGISKENIIFLFHETAMK